ncbi:MAG TPA: hypothetical protein VFK20_00565 [Vicinamibacterales bacterium]|nr:hypothetical protein [Vicinamibacterales bacterium]
MPGVRVVLALLVGVAVHGHFVGARGLPPEGELDEVIAKNIEARGGMERWSKVTTMRVAGVVNSNGTEIATLQENKRPAMVRSEFTIQGMTGIQAWDGTTGWQLMPFGGRRDPERVSEDDIKSLIESADIEGPLVNWREKGHKVEYLGIESVDGTDAHKIRVTRRNGDISYMYLDAEHYLEIRIEDIRKVRGAEVETRTDLGNYETVDGLVVPFLFEMGQKGNPNTQKLRITKVEVNVPIEDGRFAFPKGQGR